MKNAKILKKLFSNCDYVNQADRIIDYFLDDYTDYMSDLPWKPKKTEKINYVGIELECFTDLHRNTIIKKILENDLEKYVQLGDDSSIEPDFGEGREMRLLVPEKKLKVVLNKLSKMFKSNAFGVNDSCGLHVHLDMRNRNVNKCYQKLLKFQDVLFGMVSEDRWDNNYCSYTTPNDNDRYVAINKVSYHKHKTIEVRLHHATLNMGLVEKWVQLLLQIIGAKALPTVKSKKDVLKWVRKKKQIKSYVSKKFNEEWFNRQSSDDDDLSSVFDD